MEIKEFITEALTQILDGIEDSKKKLSSKNIKIDYDINSAQKNIEFDIAITTNEADSVKGEVGINKIIIAKVGGESGKVNSNVSRVKFTIPITEY